MRLRGTWRGRRWYVVVSVVVAACLTALALVGGSSRSGVARPATSMASGAFGGAWHAHTFYLRVGPGDRGEFRWPLHIGCGTGLGEGPPPCDRIIPTVESFGGRQVSFDEIVDGGRASIRLERVEGSVAYGVVQGSSEPSMVPDGPASLRIDPYDVLHVTPAAPGATLITLCGPAAISLPPARQRAAGINCGA